MKDTWAKLWPFIKFCLVGVVNTLVSYVVYLGLRLLLPYLLAHVLGWAVGVVVSFLLNCRFTYRVKPTWRGFALFPLSSIPNIVLSSAGVLLMVEVFGWDQRIAPLVATALAVPISYGIARTILLVPVQRAEAAAAAAMEAGTHLEPRRHEEPHPGSSSAAVPRGTAPDADTELQ